MGYTDVNTFQSDLRSAVRSFGHRTAQALVFMVVLAIIITVFVVLIVATKFRQGKLTVAKRFQSAKERMAVTWKSVRSFPVHFWIGIIVLYSLLVFSVSVTVAGIVGGGIFGIPWYAGAIVSVVLALNIGHATHDMNYWRRPSAKRP